MSWLAERYRLLKTTGNILASEVESLLKMTGNALVTGVVLDFKTEL
jgi:hypothetical protein